MVLTGRARAAGLRRRVRRSVRFAGFLVLIGVGAAGGTLVRWWLLGLFPAPAGGWPWTTMWINLSGSLLLGALLETIAVTGGDTPRGRALRLLLGTGFMGGYTTYSTFAFEVTGLIRAGLPLLAVGYAAVSVAVGIAAAGSGAWAVRWTVRRTRPAEATP